LNNFQFYPLGLLDRSLIFFLGSKTAIFYNQHNNYFWEKMDIFGGYWIFLGENEYFWKILDMFGRECLDIHIFLKIEVAVLNF